MDTKTKLVTYDDYQNLPDDGKRYEIIEGALLMTPAPTTLHQRILGKLYKKISNYTEEKEMGEVFMAPVDVVLSMTDIVEPDLLFVSKERSQIITKKNVVAAPDLTIEILSNSTAVVDRNQKKALYAKHGVKEYWIVDPEEKCIEQYVLENQVFELKEALNQTDTLTSTVINNFDLQLDKVFNTTGS